MIPAEIRKRLIQLHGVKDITPMPPGFSGAQLYRCEGRETLVLRCWPDQTTPGRVDQIHTIMAQAASRTDLLPKYRPIGIGGESYVLDPSTGSIWELATWLPGESLEYDALPELIAQGAAAIGRVHHEFRRLGRWRDTAPAIAERLQRIETLDQRLPGSLGASLQGRVHPTVQRPLEKACRVLGENWRKTLPRIAEALTSLADQRLPLQYVLRDIHREQMLFTSGTVTGIIDFDAIRVDTPAVDLARWAASFAGYRADPGTMIDHVLAGYARPEPFPETSPGHDSGQGFLDKSSFGLTDPNATTPEFRTLILTIAESTLWISLANWVVWLLVESRQFPDYPRVAERLNRLVESVGL